MSFGQRRVLGRHMGSGNEIANVIIQHQIQHIAELANMVKYGHNVLNNIRRPHTTDVLQYAINTMENNIV